MIWEFLSGNSDLILLALLAAFLTWFIIYERKKNKEKVEIQTLFKIPPFSWLFYIIMYRTKLGLDKMSKWAEKHKRTLSILIPVIIFSGIAGMAFISYTLLASFIKMFTVKTAAPAAQLVLPVKSSFTFYVPFMYWIISIFLIATVHEMSHGIIARFFKIKVKSSGFAFLGILAPIVPAAFVEPDEKQIVKRPAREQLAVYAAGPFSNLVFGLLALLLLLFVFSPVSASLYNSNGIMVGKVSNVSSLYNTSFNTSSERIVAVNGVPTLTISNLTTELADLHPGESVTLTTNVSNYTINLKESPDNSSRAFIGITQIQESQVLKNRFKPYSWLVSAYSYIAQLVWFLFILNIGIGLVNLLPIFIADGGRMMFVMLKDWAKLSEEKAAYYTNVIGMVFLIVLLGTIFLPLTPLLGIIHGLL